MPIVEDELPGILNGQNVTDAQPQQQPQIDLNDEIEMPQLQPNQPPAVQNGNQSKEEPQQQQPQHSVDVIQPDPHPHTITIQPNFGTTSINQL